MRRTITRKPIMRPGLVALAAAIALSTAATPAAAAPRLPPISELLKAVNDGDGNKVVALVASGGPALVNTTGGDHEQTALHLAAQKGNIVWTSYFLSVGGNPDIVDGDGMTPLMYAVMGNNLELAQTLIDGGAGIDFANKAGETPLIRAVHLGKVSMARLLVRAGADPDRADYSSGQSARDYAEADTRSRAMAEVLKTARRATAAPAAGPTLSQGN